MITSIQCGVITTRSIVSKINTKDTPKLARFVDPASDSYALWVYAIIYTISYYIGQLYNGTVVCMVPVNNELNVLPLIVTNDEVTGACHRTDTSRVLDSRYPSAFRCCDFAHFYCCKIIKRFPCIAYYSVEWITANWSFRHMLPPASDHIWRPLITACNVCCLHLKGCLRRATN